MVPKPDQANNEEKFPIPAVKVTTQLPTLPEIETEVNLLMTVVEIGAPEVGPSGKVRKAIIVEDGSHARETITLWDALATDLVLEVGKKYIITGAQVTNWRDQLRINAWCQSSAVHLQEEEERAD